MNINMCSDEHDEVCFTGSHCPVCGERDKKKAEIDELETQIDNLKAEIADRYQREE